MEANENVIIRKKQTQRSLGRRLQRKMRHIVRKTYVGAYRHVRASKPFVAYFERLARAEFVADAGQTAKVLSPEEKRIIGELEQEGIAFSSIGALFGSEAPLRELHDFVTQCFDVEARVGTQKKFLEYLWDNHPELDLHNPIVALALQDEILRIVNSYLSLYSRFVFFSANRTYLMHEKQEAAGSQRWHRDPNSGNTRMCKVFTYLSDVDLGAGPFMYVRGSHRGGRWWDRCNTGSHKGIYPPKEAIEEGELADDIVSAVGKAGTLVFCDTMGLHKGGYSTKTERTMTTLYYVSPGSIQKQMFRVPQDIGALNQEISGLPKATRWALGRER